MYSRYSTYSSLFLICFTLLCVGSLTLVNAQTTWCYRWDSTLGWAGLTIQNGTVTSRGIEPTFNGAMSSSTDNWTLRFVYPISGTTVTRAETRIIVNAGYAANSSIHQVWFTANSSTFDRVSYGQQIGFPDYSSDNTLVTIDSQSSGEIAVLAEISKGSSVDVNTPHDGYAQYLEIEGTGVNPLGADNCALPTPTPTMTILPTQTLTPTPTLTPTTSPPNNNPDVNPLEICADIPVNAGDVSNEYRASCSHCIGFASDDSPSPTPNEYWYTQTAIYAGTPSTQEATPTIMYGELPTDVVTVSTQYYASPTPQDGMPSAQSYSCSSFPCNDNFDAVTGTIVSGELQSDDIGSERLITVRYNAPIVSGFPLQLNFISMGYTLTQPTYTGLDGFISVRNATGIVIFETWFDASSSSFIIEPQETYGGAVMDWSPSAATSILVSLYASRQAPLDGSIAVTALSMSVEDPENELIDSEDVVCSAPQDYPFEQMTLDDLFSFEDIYISSEPTCLPLMVEIDATSFVNALTSFMSVSTPEWIGIPAIEMCITWQTIPDMTVFQVNIPIIEIISAIVVGWFIKTLLRM